MRHDDDQNAAIAAFAAMDHAFYGHARVPRGGCDFREHAGSILELDTQIDTPRPLARSPLEQAVERIAGHAEGWAIVDPGPVDNAGYTGCYRRPTACARALEDKAI